MIKILDYPLRLIDLLLKEIDEFKDLGKSFRSAERICQAILNFKPFDACDENTEGVYPFTALDQAILKNRALLRNPRDSK